MNIEEFQNRHREIMETYVTGFENIASDFSLSIDALMAAAKSDGIDDDLLAAIVIVENKKMVTRIDDVQKELS